MPSAELLKLHPQVGLGFFKLCVSAAITPNLARLAVATHRMKTLQRHTAAHASLRSPVLTCAVNLYCAEHTGAAVQP